MNGRSLIIRIATLLIFSGMGLISVRTCGAAGPPGPIAILLSDSQEAYTKPVASFIDEIQMPVQVFNLKGEIENAPHQMAGILSSRPALIFALGAKAAVAAKFWTTDRPELPVVFAMVLNWQRYGLLDGQRNLTGIASEVAPGTQLANMTIASPRVKTVGVVYSKAYSSETVQKARKAAEKLGLKIIDIPITHPREFRQAYKKISDRIDGYWMLADPVVYTLENVDWLRDRCARDQLVCIGQSRNIAEMGILLAVNPDVVNVGRQAASMAKNILLHHQRPEQIGVMPPLGTTLVLNAHTAEKIGLELNHMTMDLAGEIIGR